MRTYVLVFNGRRPALPNPGTILGAAPGSSGAPEQPLFTPSLLADHDPADDWVDWPLEVWEAFKERAEPITWLAA